MVGKAFGFRLGTEMRSLAISQIERFRDPDRYFYMENMSKTNSGTFKKLHISTKVVPVFACPQAGERCTVYLLDLNLSKLPQEAFTQDAFYLCSLEKMSSDPHHPWYTNVPVGKNTLERKLAIICDRAGINQCLRVPKSKRSTWKGYTGTNGLWKLFVCTKDQRANNIELYPKFCPHVVVTPTCIIKVGQ